MFLGNKDIYYWISLNINLNGINLNGINNKSIYLESYAFYSIIINLCYINVK